MLRRQFLVGKVPFFSFRIFMPQCHKSRVPFQFVAALSGGLDGPVRLKSANSCPSVLLALSEDFSFILHAGNAYLMVHILATMA